ncbi:MAG: hypothetical protein OHK0039_27650 [Bacteroidia bacterium]
MPEPSREAYFRFILSNSLKGLLWLGAIVGAYVLADYLLPEEWNRFLKPFTDRPVLMFSIFFFSETFTGLIPLELFVIWASKNGPMNYGAAVALMSLLSYIGGYIAYLLGQQIKNLRWLHRLTELEAYRRNQQLYRRWGGIVIILAALTPLPYAIICFLSGTFHFPWQRFLLYSATRFLRFAVVGWILVGI